MIVTILKGIDGTWDVDTGAIIKITGSVDEHDPKRVRKTIKRFKNERYPSIAVTVDLLTTGIDVPEIPTLVFMRRVTSRILFEQMLGQATRLCPKIHKTHFEIYDLVGVYEALEPYNTMNIDGPKNREKIITTIDGLDWFSPREGGLGNLYEGLLEKNVSEKKSGAEHYFTPRVLIEVMTRLMKPQPDERCNDPACGTFGFMTAAYQYMKEQTDNFYDLDVETTEFEKTEAFTGCELVHGAHRLSCHQTGPSRLWSMYERQSRKSCLPIGVDFVSTLKPF